MTLLRVKSRQALYENVKRGNIRVLARRKPQPHLYSKADIEAYVADNKKGTVTWPSATKEDAIEQIKAKLVQVDTQTVTPGELNEALLNKKDNLLNRLGQDEYERVLQLLDENGTYKDQDRALVLLYALSYQNWLAAAIASAEENNIITTQSSGAIKTHPLFYLAERCAKQMLFVGTMLGIGARSRIGLNIPQPKKESIFDFLKNKDLSFND